VERRVWKIFKESEAVTEPVNAEGVRKFQPRVGTTLGQKVNINDNAESVRKRVNWRTPSELNL
jgi:hypothetical protein